MAAGNPPTSVGELITKVTQSAANIAKHREAMAAVSSQIKTTLPLESDKGVTKP
jgi:hypothetical protein